MAAKKVTIQIPKVIFKAIGLSILAQIVFALIINQLLLTLPFTPEHQAQSFLDLNHQNPMVYADARMQQLQSSSGTVDAAIATPLILLVGSIVFILCLPFATWPAKRALKTALINGIWMSISVLVLGLVLSQLVQSESNVKVSPFDPSKLPIATVQSIYNVCAFMLGAWIGTALRKKAPSTSVTSAPNTSTEQAA